MTFKSHERVVLVASIASAFFNFGFPASMGAMYIGLLETFGDGRAKTALVQSLLVTFCWSFGVVGGILITKYGIKIVSYVAALLTATGLFVSYFATSIYQLYGLISILAGIGFASMYMCAVVSVGLSFTGNRKSIVLAIQSSGTAISGFVWPSLLTASITEYGFRGTCLILCGIFLNNIPLSIIFSKFTVSKDQHPIEMEYHINDGLDESWNESRNYIDANDVNYSETLAKKQKDAKSHTVSSKVEGQSSNVPEMPESFEMKSGNQCSYSEKENKVLNCPNVNESLGTHYVDRNDEKRLEKSKQNLKDACFSKLGCLFAIFVVSGVCNMSTLAGYLSVYQDVNVHRGLTLSQSDMTFMSYSLLNLLSRLMPVIPAKYPRINKFMVPVISSLSGALSQLLLILNTSFASAIISMAFIGISAGGWMSSMQAISFEILPQKYRATGFGFMLTSMGIAVAAMGPIFGTIRDDTDSYHYVFVIATSLFLLSFLLSIVSLVLSRHQQKGS